MLCVSPQRLVCQLDVVLAYEPVAKEAVVRVVALSPYLEVRGCDMDRHLVAGDTDVIAGDGGADDGSDACEAILPAEDDLPDAPIGEQGLKKGLVSRVLWEKLEADGSTACNGRARIYRLGQKAGRLLVPSA